MDAKDAVALRPRWSKAHLRMGAALAATGSLPEACLALRLVCFTMHTRCSVRVSSPYKTNDARVKHHLQSLSRTRPPDRRALLLEPASEDLKRSLAHVETACAASCLQATLRGHAGKVHDVAFRAVRHDGSAS